MNKFVLILVSFGCMTWGGYNVFELDEVLGGIIDIVLGIWVIVWIIGTSKLYWFSLKKKE